MGDPPAQPQQPSALSEADDERNSSSHFDEDDDDDDDLNNNHDHDTFADDADYENETHDDGGDEDDDDDDGAVTGVGMLSFNKKRNFRKKKKNKLLSLDAPATGNNVTSAGRSGLGHHHHHHHRDRDHHHHKGKYAVPPIPVATSEEEGGEERTRQYISHLFGPSRERGLEPMDAEMEAAATLQYKQQRQLHAPQTNLRKLHHPHGHHHRRPPHRSVSNNSHSSSGSNIIVNSNSLLLGNTNSNNNNNNNGIVAGTSHQKPSTSLLPHRPHSNPRPHRPSSSDPPRPKPSARPASNPRSHHRPHSSRRKKRWNRIDGYENSGHETSDFYDRTEDETSKSGGEYLVLGEEDGFSSSSSSGSGSGSGSSRNCDADDDVKVQDGKQKLNDRIENENAKNSDFQEKVVKENGGEVEGGTNGTTPTNNKNETDDIGAAISNMSIECHQTNKPTGEINAANNKSQPRANEENEDLAVDSTPMNASTTAQEMTSPSPQSKNKRKNQRSRGKKNKKSPPPIRDRSKSPIPDDGANADVSDAMAQDDSVMNGESTEAPTEDDVDVIGKGRDNRSNFMEVEAAQSDKVKSDQDHKNKEDSAIQIMVSPQSKKSRNRRRRSKQTPKKGQGDEPEIEGTDGNANTEGTGQVNTPQKEEHNIHDGQKSANNEDTQQMHDQPGVNRSLPSTHSKKTKHKKRGSKHSPKKDHDQTQTNETPDDVKGGQLTQPHPDHSSPQKHASPKHTPKKHHGSQDHHQLSPQSKEQTGEDGVHDHDPHEDEDDYPTSHDDNDANSLEAKHSAPQRTLEEELTFLKRISPTRYQVQLGFVPGMKVPAEIIVNNDLQSLLVQELHDSCCGMKGGCSFIPALRQAANVAALPGIVRASLAMPDVHSGYGFCIGNVAAFDMEDPSAVISPGGVGFDINCGVRLIRTNLTEDDVDETMREKLAEAMFKNIPVGVGVGGVIPCSHEELDELLVDGIDWAVKKGYAWKEDKEHCEENGRMDTADPKCVSSKAKRRGLKQLGTLGAGNHYAEIQVVEEIYHPEAAKTMGIGKVGQVCIMIHTGSRGLGHQVATDALTVMEKAMARDHIALNDLQLSCARIQSREGKEYLAGMSAAANFAWVNRSCITYLTRKAFQEVFEREPLDMDMHLIYDVCHNIAKVENHVVDGVEKTLLVHRKGSTRAFPPNHPNIPKDYQSIGQPVLIGGTMGTCSYVLVGTQKGMSETFGSTCHGAGRALSRNQSRKRLDHEQILNKLKEDGIAIRVASPKLVTEEAPESYKNVCDVIETCQDAGISEKVVKLRPIAVIKG